MFKKKGPTRGFIAGFILFLFFLSVFSSGAAAKGSAEVNFHGDLMTVKLQDMPLKQLLEKIQKEKGIWFDANGFLPEIKLSMQFENIPLEKALHRFLFKYNYVLFFDHNQNPTSITIFGSKKHNEKPSNRMADRVASAAVSSSSGMSIISIDSESIQESDPFTMNLDLLNDSVTQALGAEDSVTGFTSKKKGRTPLEKGTDSDMSATVSSNKHLPTASFNFKTTPETDPFLQPLDPQSNPFSQLPIEPFSDPFNNPFNNPSTEPFNNPFSSLPFEPFGNPFLLKTP